MATTARKSTRPARRAPAAAPAKSTRSAKATTTPAPQPVAKPALKSAIPPVVTARAPSPAVSAAVVPPQPAKKTRQAKADKAIKAGKPEKLRVKLVRDGFTMPQADFALIDLLKARAVEAKRPAKKSELLRAGLHALAALAPMQLIAALNALAPVKTGRPKKAH